MIICPLQEFWYEINFYSVDDIFFKGDCRTNSNIGFECTPIRRLMTKQAGLKK